MPIPLYAPPPMRSSRSPNPFDRAQAPRLRILVDAPLVAGPVDGAGDYHGYPFLGGGSTGYPDAGTVLRSYLTHPGLEILRIRKDLAEVGDVVLGEPEPFDPDSLSFEVKTEHGERYTGIDYYGEAVEEGAAFASRHGVTPDEGLQAALLYRVGAVLEADLIVTDREWLLAERGRPHGDFLAPLVSAAEAFAEIGLYLRWHRQPVTIGGAVAGWHPTAMRNSAAYTAMPAFERWNQAGRTWHDRSGGDLRIENLNQTLLTRVSRAFQFRDSVFALAATMAGFEPEELLCELDSLLFSLVGAFDVTARITDLLLGMNTRRGGIGWQYTRSDGWQRRLEPIAKDLYDTTAAGTEMQQRAFQVLRWLRNSVHNEALDLTREKQTFYVTVETGTQDDLRGFLREGNDGWAAADLGIRIQPPGGATAAKWLPGTGRYSVTVRRTGAPRPADPLEGTLIFEARQLHQQAVPRLPERPRPDHAAHTVDRRARLPPRARAALPGQPPVAAQ